MPNRRVTHLHVDGMSIRVYSSSGPPSASPRPAFLLLHGIGMSHRYFSRLHDRLAEVADVHAIDLPGYGANTKPGRDLSVADNADLIAATATIMGVDRFAVIGHSMGVQFAVEIALRHPLRVRSLVLIGPVVDPERRTLRQQAGRLAADTLAEAPDINAVVFTDYVRCGIPWYLNQLRDMLSYPIEDRIGLVPVPVLIMRGVHDPIATDAWCRTLAARAGGAPVVTVPGGAHVIQQRRPVAARDAIVAFAAAATEPVGSGSGVPTP